MKILLSNGNEIEMKNGYSVTYVQKSMRSYGVGLTTIPLAVIKDADDKVLAEFTTRDFAGVIY
jgi:hypothetical protein|nr:MAG TPA: hypothetical protein [Caudoviricetes sp.]